VVAVVLVVVVVVVVETDVLGLVVVEAVVDAAGQLITGYSAASILVNQREGDRDGQGGNQRDR
jgi:hypothetical protein